MKILIAMDSFKGTLSSLEAGETIKKAFLTVFPDALAKVICVADGGEGMVEAMMRNLNGEIIKKIVSGPLGKPVEASLCLANDTAVIEMAAASGLTLLKKEECDPYRASTYGTGELMLAAMDAGAKKIIVGLGGSATNDGGAGMAQALGVRLEDKAGKELERGGMALKDLAKIDLSGIDPRIKDIEIVAACDVKNPLCGKNGATCIYGPQKGVTPDHEQHLDSAIKNLADRVFSETGIDYENAEGAGAAGGLGYGLMAFCGAKVEAGIDTVLRAAKIEEILLDTDLVITGEGSIDSQTVFGKTPVGVAKYAKKRNIPVIAIAGQAKEGYEAVYDAGIDALAACVNRIMQPEEAYGNAKTNLFRAAENTARMIRIGSCLR